MAEDPPKIDDSKNAARSHPDRSEEWFTRLKDELKSDNKRNFWVTVAGSSVIAALLGVIANFGLEFYKARLNHDLERFKVDVQNKSTQLAETREAYSKLANGLEKVEEDLKTYLSTCEIAAQHPENDAQFSRWAGQTWDSLTDHMAELRTAESNIKVDAAISQEISNLFGQIVANQEEVQKAPHKNSQLLAKKEQLLQSFTKIKAEIESKKNSLAL